MLNKRNGHNGHARNGFLASRSPDCPKCRGFVSVRYDPYLGWESYCINCGWTPLTDLSIHVIPEDERRYMVMLRRLARSLVAMELDTEEAQARV